MNENNFYDFNDDNNNIRALTSDPTVNYVTDIINCINMCTNMLDAHNRSVVKPINTRAPTLKDLLKIHEEIWQFVLLLILPRHLDIRWLGNYYTFYKVV